MHQKIVSHVRVAALLCAVLAAGWLCPVSVQAEDEGMALELHCTKEIQKKYSIDPSEMQRTRASIDRHQMQIDRLDIYVKERAVPEWKKSVKKGYPVESRVEVVTTGGVVLKSRVTPSNGAALDREISRAIERCMAEYAQLRKQSRKAPLTVYNL